MFTFTGKGKVKWWSQNGKTGMMLVDTREKARQFVKSCKKRGVRLSIADIGSIQGETLLGQLDASLKEGADCTFILRSLEGDDIVCDILERRSGQ